MENKRREEKERGGTLCSDNPVLSERHPNRVGVVETPLLLLRIHLVQLMTD